jgi:hypothetical protein
MLLSAGIVAQAQEKAEPNASRAADRAAPDALAQVDQVEIVDLSDICVIPNGKRCQVLKKAEPGTPCRCGATAGTIR